MTKKELLEIEEIVDLLIEAKKTKKIDYTYYCWIGHRLEDLYNKYVDKTFQIIDITTVKDD